MNFWEKIKDKTRASQIKLRMIFQENNIEEDFLRLGTRAYDLRRGQVPISEEPEVNRLLQDITTRKKELALLKEEFRKFWVEEAKALKANLEKGGGILEQVELPFHSPAIGRKIKDLELPKEVLLGPIVRDKDLVIPDGETELREADRVTLMGKKKDVQAAALLLRGNP